MSSRFDKIGYHTSISGGISSSFERAKALTCTAMQIFATNPRSWALSYVSAEEKKLFRKHLLEFGEHSVVVHMPYLPNIASPNRYIHKRSESMLTDNVRRCSELGVKYLVVHLGSHMGEGKRKGIENAANTIGDALGSHSNTMLLLENEAGHKNSVGDKLEELADIKELSGAKGIGYCLDTCHLFAAGYDIADHEVLDSIDSVLDFANVRAFHLNDAMHELGSGLDRHDNIGCGKIGVKGFESFLSYEKIVGTPLILETPAKGAGVKELSLVRKIAGCD